ncbi:MAG: chorismate synthase [Lachnospiraceae bacterium]|nr:chorismate synthase [Lachnospiraceae bacterium]
MAGTYGEFVRLTLTGTSHGPSVGMMLEGVPAGERVDQEKLREFLLRRSPGRNEYSSQRKEPDEPYFYSGIRNGVTTGDVIVAEIENRDVRPEDYEKSGSVPRPGHADYTSYVKYGKIMPGGGSFSGRMTAPLCVAGGIVLQILEREGIRIFSRIASVAGIEDEGELSTDVSCKPFPTVNDEQGRKMLQRIMDARNDGDSVGGVAECVVTGLPSGLGGPLFDGMESRISQAIFGIPAVKGVEFGEGFCASRMRGSENNDPFVIRDGKVCTATNHAGGILGGITDGMPLVFRAAFKPTPSIEKPQASVDLLTMEPVTLETKGRHDPCIVVRALPAVESAAAIAVYDALLSFRYEKKMRKADVLERERESIARTDRKILELFELRMASARAIGDYKEENGLSVQNAKVETEKIRTLEKDVIPPLKPYVKPLFEKLFSLSRDYQERTIREKRKYENEERERRKNCGLLGRKLSHSYSPEIHEMFGLYDYELFELEPEEVESFLKNGESPALNVTVPYKQKAFECMDELSPEAWRTKSVNTVKRLPDGRLFGDNTDVYGFIRMVRHSGIAVEGKKVLVLGDGGASKAVQAALKDLHAKEVVVSSRSHPAAVPFYDAEVLVNATPVGMYPDNGESPADLTHFPRLEGVLDLIYNPARTALLLQAEKLGIPNENGLYMLVEQARKSAEIFTGSSIDDQETDRIYETLLNRMLNIVLIGMPGVGKTAFGKALCRVTGRIFLDTDEMIEQRYDRTPEEIILKEGEEAFRRKETAELSFCSKLSGAVIATGGGVVTRPENYPLLHQNGRIIWLKRDVGELTSDGRPLSQGTDLMKMYEERKPLYEAFADEVCDLNGMKLSDYGLSLEQMERIMNGEWI